MTRLLRNIGFFLIVAVLTLAIFLLVNENQKVNHDVLEYSVELLEGKLLAMVPDGAGKTAVRQQYKKFLAQIKNKELPPEQVEQIAVNILNAANAESTITAEVALSCLTTTVDTIVLSKIVVIEDSGQQKSTGKSVFHLRKNKKGSFEKSRSWDRLGDRISAMYLFNEDMQDFIRNNAEIRRNLHKQIRFHRNTGIKVALNPEIKRILVNYPSPRLAAELKRFEKDDLIIWQEELQALRKNKRRSDKKLHALEELKRLESLQKLIHLRNPGHLVALSSDTVSVISDSNNDSTHRIIEKRLQKAGVIPDKYK